jgi:N-acetylglucosaminyldiphosphoundecaprenol N-acetyl-beta-D-mannosaminyltransferase
MTDPHARHLSLVGVRIDALEHGDLIDLVERAKSTKTKLLILNHNLHSLHIYFTNPNVRAAYAKASWIYIDGMPVVWCSRLAGLPVTRRHRITFLESFDSILVEAERYGWRVFYLGSAAKELTAGIALLRSRHPHLTIDGHHGYFSNSRTECDEVIAQINDFGADILFVGMGMPIQEMWLAEHFSRIHASAMLTSGATLDYVTGHAYRPPAWTGPLGLYGIFRLFAHPRRLWRRYLIEPILLTKYLALPIIRQRMRKQCSP